MAREIDPQAIEDQTLTYDEALYLRDRGRLPAGYPMPEPSEGEGEGGGVPPKPPETMEDQVIQKYPVETQYPKLDDQDVPEMGNRGGIASDEEDEEEDYVEGWSNDQRRAELSRRGLSVEGRKDDLIARLRRSDTDELLDEDADPNAAG